MVAVCIHIMNMPPAQKTFICQKKEQSLHAACMLWPLSLVTCVGASDCAACVGTALEVARVIVSDPSIQLAAPLVLLLNGGEETILTAAHGTPPPAFQTSGKCLMQCHVLRLPYRSC
jgi:NaMN:DMB phosphoribosyltransferase